MKASGAIACIPSTLSISHLPNAHWNLHNPVSFLPAFYLRPRGVSPEPLPDDAPELTEAQSSADRSGDLNMA
jgi:hypothetical protein